MATKSDSKSNSSQQGSSSNKGFDPVSPDQLKSMEADFAGQDSEQVAAQKQAETDALNQQFQAPSAQGVGANRGGSPLPEITPHRDSFQNGPKEEAIPNKNNGFYKAEKPNTKAENAKQLHKRENEASEELYTGDKEDKKGKKKGFWNKKKTAAAGGIAGIALGGGLLGLTSILGPLEFVHLAQNLHAAHFSQQENGGDSRLGKLFRWARSGNVGETRLGYLSSKYHAKIITKLSDIGFKPVYDGTLNTYTGMEVDTKNEKSPYHGMSNDEIAKTIEAKTGIKPTIGSDGKVKIDASKFWNQKTSLKFALNDLGDTTVTTAIRSRVLAKFGMVSWHPLTIADKKLNNTAAKLTKAFSDKWKNRISNGKELTPIVDPKKAQNGELNKDGSVATNPDGSPTATTPISDADATAATSAVTPEKSASILKSLATGKTASVVGGIAGVAAVVCALKGVDDSLPAIRYAQIILPAMRMALNMMTVGYQIESNQGVDPAELKYLSQFFTQYDATGKLVSSWSDAKSIRSENGQTGGVDLSSKTKNLVDTSQSKVSWLEWTQNGFFSGLCSTVGSILTGVVSVTLGVLSGNTISTVVGLIGGILVAGPLLDQAASLVAGTGLNVLGLRGAQWGSVVDAVGAVAGANAQAIPFGANQLTKKQAFELDQQSAADEQDDFNQKSFFARAFDPNDYRSLTAKFIDSETGSVATNVASMFQGALSTVGSVFKLPLNLYSSTVHADSGYDYPMPIYGFSSEDQANAAVQDPYANADAVAKLLDTNNQGGTPDYIARAANCYGVNIAKTTDTGSDGTTAQTWDAIPTNTPQDTTKYGPEINPYNPEYQKDADCNDPSTDWLRVRFFIWDTGIMEGYACSDLDDAISCTNDGVASSPNSGTNTTGSAAGDTSSVTPAECKGTVTGAQNIICGAYLFDPYGYNNQSGRRTDEPNLINEVLQGKIAAGTNIVDCSAMVDAAIYYAYGIDLQGAATAAYPGEASLKEIPLDQAVPGDIAWWHEPDGHTEVIVSYDKSSGTFHTFGSHMNYTDVTKDISPATYPSSGTWAVQKVFRVVAPTTPWTVPTAASPAK